MAVAGEAEHAEHGVAGRPHQRVVLGDHEVLEHAHLAEQADVLEGPGDAGARDPEPVHLLEQQLLTVGVEGELADRRLVEAGQAVEHRGLAGAVRPDDRGDLTLIRGERQVVDRDQTAETHGQTLDLEQGAPLMVAPARPRQSRARHAAGWSARDGRTGRAAATP